MNASATLSHSSHEDVTEDRLPRRLVRALGEFLRTKQHRSAISISKLTRATRSVDPGLTMTDARLSDLIARELMHAGVAIDFDRSVAQTNIYRLVDGLPARAGTSMIMRDEGPLDLSARPGRH